MSSLKLFSILYYLTQIDSKLLCFCSVIDHRWGQNVVRTSVTHSAAPCMPLFCSYHILTSSVIYYWTYARQLGIYLLNIKSMVMIFMNSSSHFDSHPILSWFTFCSWKWLCYQHVPVYVLQFMSRGFEQASYPCDFHIGAKVSGCFIVVKMINLCRSFHETMEIQCSMLWLKYWKVNIFLKFMYSLIVSLFVCLFFFIITCLFLIVCLDI